jgi:hypothetical protein
MKISPQSSDCKFDQGSETHTPCSHVQRLKRSALYVTLASLIPMAVLQWTVGLDNLDAVPAVVFWTCGLVTAGGLSTMKMFSLAQSVDSMPL